MESPRTKDCFSSSPNAVGGGVEGGETEGASPPSRGSTATYLLPLVALLTLMSCSKPSGAPAPPPLTQQKQGTILTNGLIGLRISGPGKVDQMLFDTDYDTGIEEKINPWKNPLAIGLLGQDATVTREDLQVGKSLTQTIKSSKGQVTITFELPPNEQKLHLTVEHPAEVTPAPENDPRLTLNPDLSTTTKHSWWITAKTPGGLAARLPVPGNEPAARIQTGSAEDDKLIASLIDNLSTGVGRIPSPMGLTNTHYFGHVFWDADVWMLPALAFVHPSRAKMIPNYRLATVEGAKENFKKWIADGRPIGDGQKLGAGWKPFFPRDPSPPMKFAWESSQSGRETVPGESKYQDHISASVCWGLDFAIRVGMADEMWVSYDVTNYYLARTVAVDRGWPQKLSLPATMSPDEFHTGDDDLYTNAVVNPLFQGGLEKYLELPRDEKSYLNYKGDKGSGYKQAAGVLAIFPLQQIEGAEAEKMLRRFMPGVTKNGPAMTDSVHATILARLGHADEAYKLWIDNLRQFTDHPNLAFSEKRNAEKTYFYTGAAGFLNTVLYGFAGLRVDSKPHPKALWKTQLKDGWLSVIPNVPSAWKQIVLQGLWVNEKQITLTITNGKVVVTP